ncbi:uncharacterized protein LOC122256269 [Penaeus japonicus]|uniref:uncharacterized protein LOC122256269 n=1 Tax=Penaeus japonicus TaxID=27405 RepID=UPI001C713E0D|nr:uncharacterized protein LOC122256269 [Penaeus japonicus]
MVRFKPLGGLIVLVMILHKSSARDVMETTEISADEDHDSSNTREKREAMQRHVNSRINKYEKLKQNGAGFEADHQNLNSTFKTIKEYLETSRIVRRGMDVELSDHENLRKLSELMSEANLRLFSKDRDEEQAIHDSLQRASGRTFDQCGGSSAMGIFNFLTFIVYAFSLLASLVAVATGNMANTLSGTFLSGLLNLLGNGGGRRSIRSVWKDKESGSPDVKDLHRALEHDLGVGLVAALLQLSGGSKDAGSCLPPISSFAREISAWEARARISGVR